MPKWGLTMTEGKVVQWLQPRRRVVRSGRRTAGDRDLQDHQRPGSRGRRHAAARRRAGRQHIADRRIARGDRAGGRSGGGGRQTLSPASWLPNRRSAAGEAVEAPAPRMLELPAAAALPGTAAAAASAPVAAAARFRCRSQQLDVHPAGAGRRPPRGGAGPARPWRLEQGRGCRRWGGVQPGGGGLPRCARIGAGASGGPFDGRCDRGVAGGAAPGPGARR